MIHRLTDNCLVYVVKSPLEKQVRQLTAVWGKLMGWYCGLITASGMMMH